MVWRELRDNWRKRVFWVIYIYKFRVEEKGKMFEYIFEGQKSWSSDFSRVAEAYERFLALFLFY